MQQLQEKGLLRVFYLPSQQNIADGMTKPLGFSKFMGFRNILFSSLQFNEIAKTGNVLMRVEGEGYAQQRNVVLITTEYGGTNYSVNVDDDEAHTENTVSFSMANVDRNGMNEFSLKREDGLDEQDTTTELPDTETCSGKRKRGSDVNNKT